MLAHGVLLCLSALPGENYFAVQAPLGQPLRYRMAKPSFQTCLQPSEAHLMLRHMYRQTACGFMLCRLRGRSGLTEQRMRPPLIMGMSM